jgi:hypothetical protein
MTGSLPQISMRAALADPKLLGAALDGDSRLLWRTILIAAMGERLTDEERPLFTLATGRECEPFERVDEFWGIIGRRGGKTSAIAVLAIYLACLVDYDHVLTAGERGIVLVIAKTVSQAEVLIAYISGKMRASPLLAGMITWQNESSIYLANGIRIEAHPSSFRDLRSRTCVAVVGDEIAFWHDDSTGSKNPDAEILISVRPSLLTTGGPLIAIGSPYAMKGEMWKAAKRDYGPDGDPLVMVAKGATTLFNPSVSQAAIDRWVARDPVSGRSEYYAEFRSSSGDSYLSYEEVDRAIVTGRQSLPPQEGILYFAGSDPAGGGGQDSMTMAIGHIEDGVRIVDLTIEATPPFNTDATVEAFARSLHAYGVTKIVGDGWGNEWVVQAFAKYGITYGMSEDKKRNKSEFYAEARTLFSNSQVELPDNDRLRTQLLGLVRRAGGGGRETVDHPVGGHDDIANSVAIVLAMMAIKTRDPSDIWFEMCDEDNYRAGVGPRPWFLGAPMPGEILPTRIVNPPAASGPPPQRTWGH